jgi:hypothetical protein
MAYVFECFLCFFVLVFVFFLFVFCQGLLFYNWL